jgi:hypothetical protein
MLAAQLILTVLSTRGEEGGMVGTVGLTMLGAGSTVGMLGEPIVYRVLSPMTFDAPKAALVSALIVLPSVMSILGMKRLRAMSKGR